MKKRLLYLCTLLCVNVLVALAQSSNETLSEDGFTVVDNSFNPNSARDSLKASHKKVPQGMFVWSIDKRFGDIVPQVRDTAQHLFMNTIFTTGKYGEYNTTGNLGSPRIARIATDRDFSPRDEFLEPYSFFITKPHELLFTNTLSPITELFYSSCGNKTNGEDHLRAIFATNVNKRLGFGFKFNYVYGRGYYQNQSTALFDYSMWGAYTGERYQAHLIFSFDHMKNTENGGIFADYYITNPDRAGETYSENEIPTRLNNNWNRMDGFHLTFSHRYNIGFTRQVEMTEMEKEAKRFALRSAAENEAKKANEKENEKNGGNTDQADQQSSRRRNESSTTAAPKKKFAGRPDDAIIVGDLPLNKKDGKLELDSAALALVDSISAKKKTESNDTSWLKDEYVPVTSFIHNMQFDTNHRTYIAYNSPSQYYTEPFNIVPQEDALGDSIDDHTRYYTLKNTFALALMEGFNKYVPMGMKLFITHDMRHYKLPNTDYGYTSYNEHNVSVGAQIIKTLGTKIHYKATGEFTLVGKDIGNLLIDGDGDLNLRIFGDTAQVKLKGFYHLTTPTFLQRHYHSKHFSWDNDGFNKQMQTHLEASFHLAKTKTTLRACYDNIQNLVYLATSYGISNDSVRGLTINQRQTSSNISLFTLAIEQNARLGILNWENRITFQKSSQQEILPVPAINIWTNLYINFRIARVLRVHLGAEAYYFTKYEAPEYVSQLGQYAVQENSEVRTTVGGYPLVNAYANFCLKKCRFFVMMSHVNAGSGSKNYFLTPHHPLNTRVLRFGISWNFIN